MSKIKKNTKNENIPAYVSVWTSVLGNIILFAIKLWAGIISSSVAVIADAWHTLSDSISSIIVLVSIKISEKNPTKKHPFGYGRADIIASGILAMLLAVIAIEFGVKGVEKLIVQETATYGTIVYIAMGLTIIFKEIMAQISIWGAKKTGKKSLKADAWHHRSDAISSIIILVGVFLSKYFWWIDGVLAVIVALVIGYTAFEIFKDVAKSIIGESPDFELKKEIKKTVNDTAGIKVYPHHIHIHEYGNHKELTLHIYLPPDCKIITAHNLTDKIEVALKEKMNMVSTIHVEPMPDEMN